MFWSLRNGDSGMDILAEAQRRAFSVWLRTERLPNWLRAAPAEFKFNPWHDPDNGRFTIAGTGRYFGRAGGGRSADEIAARHSDERRRSPSGGGGRSGGGRGGSGGGGDGPRTERFGGFAGGGGGFAGGGAGGAWDPPAQDARPQSGRDGKPGPRRASERAARVEPGISPRIARRAAEEKWQRVERNGYTYLIDARGRTRHVYGTVTMNRGQPRSRSAQASAGGSDRRASDHGGHYIARRFNGPTEAFNHFAQDANFNRSGYRALENEWARALRAGKRVEVKIEPAFDRDSQRPSSINVWYWIDGKLQGRQFPNEPAETARDKR